VERKTPSSANRPPGQVTNADGVVTDGVDVIHTIGAIHISSYVTPSNKVIETYAAAREYSRFKRPIW